MKDGIYNALIDSTSLSTDDYGQLIFWLRVGYGDGFCQGFGGFPEVVTARVIRAVMEAADVSQYASLPKKAIRVVIKDGIIVGVGHIIEERWFYRSELQGAE